jgi:hypothetical protein
MEMEAEGGHAACLYRSGGAVPNRRQALREHARRHLIDLLTRLADHHGRLD